ncbi:MAG: DNA repair protein RadC [Tenericutes bacterium]|nr:DNA repair protein RadC [Mycoplasmatota bacterium]
MIKDIIKSERPRERLLEVGEKSLSNEELLSIILKTGTKNISVKDLSRKILNEIKDISNLKDITYNKLIKIKGIGTVKAIEILASLELGRRVYYRNVKQKVKLNNTTLVFEQFKNLFINETQENFYALYLNTKTELISYKLLFKGTINTSVVHPREIFKYAFLESASSIIVIHNHPSNNTTPSKEDIELTNKLFEIGNIMAIPVIDHIIIGIDNYYSFYENMHKN